MRLGSQAVNNQSLGGEFALAFYQRFWWLY
jgi:hypothetical protein